MPIALIVGPGAAVIGIVAIFFVLRHKSVEKRSMYSARRSQIEHKVRAARQRTLTPRGHAEKPAPAPPAEPAPGSIFAPTQAPPTVTYQQPAYTPPPPTIPPPPTGPPLTPPVAPPLAAPLWEAGPAAPPTPPPYVAPPPTPEPAPAEPFTSPGPSPWEQAAAEPAYTPPPYEPPAAEPPPAEPAWSPGAPAERGAQVEPLPPAATVPGGAGWEIVSPAGGTPVIEPEGKKGKKGDGAATSSWTLASGVAPGAEQDDEVAVKKSGSAVAIAQYAVLVVGLIMVLIGVLVMVAESHVT